MLNITDYILERANFLVKKHLKKQEAKIIKLQEYWETHDCPKQCILAYNIEAEQFDPKNLDKEFSIEEIDTYIIISGTENQIHDKFPGIEIDDVGNIKDKQSISKITQTIQFATGKHVHPNNKWIFHYVKNFKRSIYMQDGTMADTGRVKYIDVSDFV